MRQLSRALVRPMPRATTARQRTYPMHRVLDGGCWHTHQAPRAVRLSPLACPAQQSQRRSRRVTLDTSAGHVSRPKESSRDSGARRSGRCRSGGRRPSLISTARARSVGRKIVGRLPIPRSTAHGCAPIPHPETLTLPPSQPPAPPKDQPPGRPAPPRGLVRARQVPTLSVLEALLCVASSRVVPPACATPGSTTRAGRRLLYR
jgi:hypothetical protein